MKQRLVNYLEDTLAELESGILRYDTCNPLFQQEIIEKTKKLLKDLEMVQYME